MRRRKKRFVRVRRRGGMKRRGFKGLRVGFRL